MRHIGPKLHKFIYGFGRKTDHQEVSQLYERIRSLLQSNQVLSENGRNQCIVAIAKDVAQTLQITGKDFEPVLLFVANLFDYEGLFLLPDVDFSEKREVSDYWDLKDRLSEQEAWLERFSEITDAITSLTLGTFQPIHSALGKRKRTAGNDGITLPIRRIDRLADLDQIVEAMVSMPFSEEIEHLGILKRLQNRIETNLVVASGGNPADVKNFSRQVRTPTKFDSKNPDDLVTTYLSGTPFLGIFEGEEDFTIPLLSRYEHHHIIAGTGHGKTQTLQYLIAQDLEAVKEGKRSIIVIDSQGDLISKLRKLAVFAPGGALFDRICIIDPEDIEYPVALNLFDVGQERLGSYKPLQREQLTNSILELYDFVLGSLLSAEMTQKQQVLFNFVTKLMLEIPDATIHTFRDIFAASDASAFMEHVERLDDTSKQFFLNEFKSKDFSQTKSQVSRRLLGILGNRNFERMFTHPKSMFDIYTEMNAGKVILINTAKGLLKASGAELLGRFFIALIAQAAQERAAIPEGERMPTFVYIDEAADYFDQNIEMILREARKYKVGMILAHQYIGQLDSKLQDAFSANTVIKFAGGVSAKDARALALQLNCETAFIDQQPKLSFATFVRGITSSAVSLQFPYGVIEDMDVMDDEDAEILQNVMRAKYAAAPKAGGQSSEPHQQDDEDAGDGKEHFKENETSSKKPKRPDERKPDDPDTPDTDVSNDW